LKDVTLIVPQTLKRFVRLPKIKMHMELCTGWIAFPVTEIWRLIFVANFWPTPPEQVRAAAAFDR